METFVNPGDHLDAPSLLIIAAGIVLGLTGIVYQLVHPETFVLWIVEIGLIVVPAGVMVYSGYWISSHLASSIERWRVVRLAAVGATAAVVLVVGYVVTEQLSGAGVSEAGRLVLHGALGGGIVAILAAVSIQRQFHHPVVNGGGRSESNRGKADATTNGETPGVLRRIGSELPSVALCSKVVKVYRREGLRTVAAGPLWLANKKLLEHGVIEQQPYHVRKRTDSPARWEMIAARLDAEDGSALDIGCASGYFAAQLADEGMVSIGIEPRRERIRNAHECWGDTEGLGFLMYFVDPETIHRLPQFDVVLLLTVYHHWCDSFGHEAAEEMLRELARTSRKIFFEPPDDTNTRFASMSDRPFGEDETVVEYYTSLLESIFDGGVDIHYLGEAEYPSKHSRTDPVFLLDCAAFTG